MRRAAWVSLLVLALGLSRPGHADPDTTGLGVLVYTLVVGGIVVTSGGVVPVIGNGVSIARHDRPGLGWITAGFTVGGIQAAAGVSMLATSPSSEDWGDMLLGFGIANAVLGALNIGLASWATVKRSRHREAETRSTRLALVPMLAPDSGGGVGYGLGVKVAGW